MGKRPPASAFKSDFIARVTYARIESKKNQEEMANDLGMPQSTYFKYEIKTYLPHDLVPLFCHLTERTMGWLFSAPVTDEMRRKIAENRRPRQRTKRKRLKVA